MSDNVIPLGARRQESTRPLVYDGFTCETCGGAWFRVLVSLDPEGRVTGNDIKGTCKDCGEPAAFPIPPEVY